MRTQGRGDGCSERVRVVDIIAAAASRRRTVWPPSTIARVVSGGHARTIAPTSVCDAEPPCPGRAVIDAAIARLRGAAGRQGILMNLLRRYGPSGCFAVAALGAGALLAAAMGTITTPDENDGIQPSFAFCIAL